MHKHAVQPSPLTTTPVSASDAICCPQMHPPTHFHQAPAITHTVDLHRHLTIHSQAPTRTAQAGIENLCLSTAAIPPTFLCIANSFCPSLSLTLCHPLSVPKWPTAAPMRGDATIAQSLVWVVPKTRHRFFTAVRLQDGKHGQADVRPEFWECSILLVLWQLCMLQQGPVQGAK